MTAFAVATAEGPPLRLIVWPVNTLLVDVPPELVSVSRTVYLPGAAYTWLATGVLVVAVVPSPKFQA
jgi:hypothetical protein